MHKTWSHYIVRTLTAILATSFFLFLGVPLASLLLHEPPVLLWSAMQQPEVLQALQLSIFTTSVSTLLTVLFGLPVASLLARRAFAGRHLLETLVTLPT